MNPFYVIAGLIFLTVLLSMLLYYRLRVSVLRKKLQTAMHNSAEIGNFLNLFSRNIRKTSEMSNWMNVTARYVADLVEAQSVCVFTLSGSTLRGSGSAGSFPRQLRTMEVDIGTKRDIKRLFGSDAEGEMIERHHAADEAAVIEEAALHQEFILIDNPGDSRLTRIEHTKIIDSLIAVPLLSEGTVVGVICAINSTRPESTIFNPDQVGRIKFIADQVVLAYDILQVYASLSEQQRIRQELDFARNLQSSMLPKSFPVWGRFVVHAFTRSSKEVSGDFYDFVEIDNDRLMVVIGDASGKGIPACMIMSMTRSFIRANIIHYNSLKNFLADLNENLFRDAGEGRFITLGVCLLNRKESTMEYARAGHTELILYVRNHIRSINPDGVALGLLPRELADFETFNMSFTPEMEFLMFTDGLNEATNAEGDYFGVDRIKNMFMKSCLDQEPPHDAVARIMGAVDDFAGKPESHADDQTLVIIRHA